jgi:hypothetical protein
MTGSEAGSPLSQCLALSVLLEAGLRSLRAALRHPPSGPRGAEAAFASLSRVTAACEARPASYDAFGLIWLRNILTLAYFD